MSKSPLEGRRGGAGDDSAASHGAQVNDGAQSSEGAGKSKGGRPKSFIHDHFESDGVYNDKTHRTGAKCLYCPYKTYNSKVSVLQHHILVDCRAVPRHVKERVAEKVAELAANPDAKGKNRVRT
jgi:hypothetical protein